MSETMERIQVQSVRKTCGACPAQWEGLTPDGRQVYARYRHGRLRVHVAADTSADEFAGINGPVVFEKATGGGYDGYMDYAELVALSGHVVEWPETDGFGVSNAELQRRGMAALEHMFGSGE